MKTTLCLGLVTALVVFSQGERGTFNGTVSDASGSVPPEPPSRPSMLRRTLRRTSRLPRPASSGCRTCRRERTGFELRTGFQEGGSRQREPGSCPDADARFRVGSRRRSRIPGDGLASRRSRPAPRRSGTFRKRNSTRGRLRSVTAAGRSSSSSSPVCRAHRRYIPGLDQWRPELFARDPDRRHCRSGRMDLQGGSNNEFSPSAESVSEFKLQTGTIGAQYGGGQTAVANFATKSGTNDCTAPRTTTAERRTRANGFNNNALGIKRQPYKPNNWVTAWRAREPSEGL